MTTTLAPEPKTNTPTSSPAPATPADLEPAARIPAGPDAQEVTPLAPRTQAGPPALLVEHVTKRFKVDRKKPPVLAINDVSLRLERGDDPRDPGRQRLRQVDPHPPRVAAAHPRHGPGRGLRPRPGARRVAVKRLINRVSVDAAFFKKLSPMENLLFAARLYGLDAKAASGRRNRRSSPGWASRENRLGRPVEQMSRGMQQKVAIARALLTSPTLLLLDEPTTGLDPRSKLDVQAYIEEVSATHEATIVLTTHDLAEAERLCSRITILDRGRVVAEDTPDGLKRMVAEGPRATADPRGRVHDLHRPVPRRGRRGGRVRRRLTTAPPTPPAARPQERRWAHDSNVVQSSAPPNGTDMQTSIRAAQVGAAPNRSSARPSAPRWLPPRPAPERRPSAPVGRRLIRLGDRVAGERDRCRGVAGVDPAAQRPGPGSSRTREATS